MQQTTQRLQIKKKTISLDDLQGQVKVQSFILVNLNYYKCFLLLPLLTILTLTMILFVMRKRNKLKVLLMYSQCSLSVASNILIFGNDESYDLTEIFRIKSMEIHFFYRKVKYILNQKNTVPFSYNLPIQNQDQINISKIKKGISKINHQNLINSYGYCEHLVDIPSLLTYLIDQLTGIFFILQYLICIIYVIQLFYLFAIVMIIFSIITTIINYFLLKSSYQRIKEIAQKQVYVQVFRDQTFQKINSRELVPGDIIRPSDSLPCDCILIQGEIFMNESSLTGQTVPIAKFSYQNNKQKCWLYEGTSVLQTRGNTLAIVIYTGFITRKGRIIRKILFRQNQQPQFFKYGFYFLLQILVYSLIIYFAFFYLMLKNQINNTLIALRFADTLGWAVPPVFPIYFNLCYSFSLYRLNKKKIYGTQPYKTIVAGKVKTICFDKTGTLTQNNMNLSMIKRFTDQNNVQEIIVKNNKDINYNDICIKLFASCHTVRKIQKEFLGDQLDLRMFLYSQYIYQKSEENSDVILRVRKQNISLQILKINQFQSLYQSMSVIVYQPMLNKYYVFVKGSPQKMEKIAVNKIKNYQTIIKDVSLAGLRSIAFGYKQINNPKSYLNISRQQLQKNIKLLGIVAFQNKLKSDTIQTILKLKQAQIQTKIITGDNIYIGVQTGLRTKILSQDTKIIVLQGKKQISQDGYRGQLIWKQRQKILYEDIYITKNQYKNQLNPIAIDNQFFQLDPLLPNTLKIFARISPQSKAKVINKIKSNIFQEWSNQSNWKKLTGRIPYKVAMVGDGANDIMAIKQADLGIGISQTDSSFAASFSIQKLKNVQQLIRQGRSTLSIAIQIFQYYGSISFLKFTASMILVWDKASYSDNQFTYFNYAQTLEIIIFLALSYPCKKLSKHIPNDNAMSFQNHLSYIGQIIISTTGLIIIYIYFVNTSQFIPNENKYYQNWVQTCQSTSVIYLCSQLYYIFSSIWLYRSFPWKSQFYKNKILFGWLLLVIGINLGFFFITDKLNSFFNVVSISFRNSGIILLITCGFLSLGFIWETVVRKFRLYQE